MKRKDFLTKGIVGLGAALGLGTLFAHKFKGNQNGDQGQTDCELSPRETRGPFPNKNSSDFVRENIIGDRAGVPLQIKLTILDGSNSCNPLPNVWVDVWHCDNHGRYSEYGGQRMRREDMTQHHFLRGRQKTDANGNVTFTSIFPGFYRGRAPHIHVEILNSAEKSILVTQIAFPEAICDTVYTTENYGGIKYVSNSADGIFRTSLNQNMADSVKGNLKSGYVLGKKIIV